GYSQALPGGSLQMTLTDVIGKQDQDVVFEGRDCENFINLMLPDLSRIPDLELATVVRWCDAKRIFGHIQSETPPEGCEPIGRSSGGKWLAEVGIVADGADRMAYIGEIISQCQYPGCILQARRELFDKWNGSCGKFCTPHAKLKLKERERLENPNPESPQAS